MSKEPRTRHEDRSEKLLPCPFCGNTEEAEGFSVVEVSQDRFAVHCRGCFAFGPYVFRGARDTDEDVFRNAVMEWNERSNVVGIVHAIMSDEDVMKTLTAAFNCASCNGGRYHFGCHGHDDTIKSSCAGTKIQDNMREAADTLHKHRLAFVSGEYMFLTKRGLHAFRVAQHMTAMQDGK